MNAVKNEGACFHALKRAVVESLDLGRTVDQACIGHGSDRFSQVRAQPFTFIGFRIYEQHGAVCASAIETVYNIGQYDETSSRLPVCAFGPDSGLAVQRDHDLDCVVGMGPDHALASTQ